MYSIIFAMNMLYQSPQNFQEQQMFSMNRVIFSDVYATDDSGFVLPSKLMGNLERLNDIARLETGWDGYSAEAIPHGLVEKVRELIFCLDEQPEIFPTGRKSIQLEYHLPDKSYLEFEVFESRIIAMQIIQRDYDKGLSSKLCMRFSYATFGKRSAYLT